MPRIRLTIAYDGGGFRGLAPNVGVRTVVGELQPVLEDMLGPIPDIHLSGRTDAGVHARQQVLSFDTDHSAPDPDRLARSINSRLGPEIIATAASIADPDFHARFSATGRRYRYVVLNHPTPWPFTARYEWWVRDRLDLGAMQAGCPALIGEHDFASFCRRPRTFAGGEPVSLVRRVDAAGWTEHIDDVGLRRLYFEVAGSAFCHQMVRSMVGLLIHVGRGKRSPDHVAEVLAARDRNQTPSPAPPEGLTLWSVQY